MNLVKDYISLIPVLASFMFIALASRPIANFFNRYHLPIISGYLIAGIVAGPYVLGLVSLELTDKLRFVDEIALGFIAFAAGAELYLKELRSRFKSITWITLSNIVIVPAIGTLSILLLADYIPFMQNLAFAGRAAIALFTGTILVARSPSSAIAIINELRAKGPFTQTILGVTMVTDVAVVILFAITSSVADTLLTGTSFGIEFLAIILLDFVSSVLIGLALAQILILILKLKMKETLKLIFILILGFSIFIVSKELRHASHDSMAFEILLEPLLICMVAGFWITNYSKYRASFSHILELGSPLVYISFFTLTGAALQLNILKDTWLIALILFLIRVFAIFISSFLGGIAAKDPMQYNRLGWATYITQAGVGLGLAKEVGVEFPEWGAAFATMIISVIVVSQLIGPLLFKWAIVQTGESFTKAKHNAFDGANDAVIFGLERQSNILARHLQDHGWNVQIACLKSSLPEISKELSSNDLNIVDLNAIDLSSLASLNLENIDAAICMLSDTENYQIAKLIYKKYGVDNIIVRLNDGKNTKKFHDMGVTTVNPSTATVNLLSEFVRSPSATSLLLGESENQDIVEIEVGDKTLHGVALRDLRLPLDVLILSIRRKGQKLLVTHGYTKLKLGDKVTVVGSHEGLKEVSLKLRQSKSETVNPSPNAK